MPELRRSLTGAQHGLWIGQQLDPASPVYNTGEFVEIRGPVDEAGFEAALRRTVAECEALNVRYLADSRPDGSWGEPYQLLDRPAPWALDRADLRAEPDPDAAADAWAATALARPVDLTIGPPFAHALLRTGERRYRWYHLVHHIALDGYGLALFARRVAHVYTDLVTGTDPGPSPFATLTAVLAEDDAYRTGPARDADRAFWTARLADRPYPTTLSDRPATAAGAPLRVVSDLDAGVVARLRELAPASGVTWPDVVIGAVAAYLRHLTGADEAILGLPVMNRLGSVSARVPCTVMNIVPLRIPLDGEATLGEFGRRVAAEIRATRPHHRYRYEDLQRDLKAVGGRKRLFGPAVNVMPFDYGLRFDGHEAVVRNVSAGPVEDLSVAVYDRADTSGLRVVLGANPERYTLDELRGHRAGLFELLDRATRDPRRSASASCPVAPPAVLDGGAPRLAVRPVPQAVADTARQCPDAVAVEHDGVTVTYGELVERAARWSAVLAARGAGPGRTVGIGLPHGIDAVVAILAALGCGAGYLPLDHRAPQRRWATMIGVVDPVVVVTDAERVADLADDGPPALLAADLDAADLDALDVDDVDAAAWPAAADPDATAYVLFTSGSTGDPKAVAISHRALATYTAGARQVYRVAPDDRALHFLPLHFDGHVEEVLVSLAAGATVVIRLPEMTQSLGRMVAGWAEHRITLLNLPTSYWHELVHGLAAGTLAMPDCVRTAIIGGEAALAGRAGQWFAAVGDRVRLINTYGPTEATVVAVAAELTAPDVVDGDVPIGTPFAGMRAVVVDEHGRLAAPGATGELHLVGDALATGYLGRPDLDAARFAPLEQLAGRPRAYRTGDLVRRHADGRLRFVGRVDDEFKVSGHRVDPGEVEAVLLGCPGIAQVAVTGQVSATGTRYLSAHVVAQDPVPSAADVRAFARGQLPAALVPTAVEFLDALPKTDSGKIDRVELRRRADGPDRSPAAADPGSDMASDLETTVLEVWQEVLGVSGLDVRDDFFDVGGQSLQTIQVANRLTARLGHEVTVAMVFRYPTVAELADGLAREFGLTGPAADTPDRADSLARSVAAMLADSELEPDVAPPAALATGPTGSAGRVLLTGATGFLGAHLLAELLARTRDQVVCPVRAGDEAEASARVRAALAVQGLPVDELDGRVEAIPADLGRPGLGLQTAELADLAGCDAIFHNASVTSVMREYASLRAVNVHGTRQLLRLACARGVPFHYVSTLNVAPPRTHGEEVVEDFLPLHPGLRDGYQQSKWAAERLVQQAAERGLPVTVHRLARLVGPLATGYVNPDDLLWRFLRVGIPIGAIPLVYRADAWTPVDYVARAVVHLAQHGKDTVYNLVPYPELPLVDLTGWINDYGYPVTLEPLDRWRAMIPDASVDITTLAFFDLWSGGDGEEDLEIGRVVTDNVTRGLAGSGIECPPPDAGLMRRYLDHCVKTGLLPAPEGER